METDWDRSAVAWLTEQGDLGDWGRRFVLDKVMMARVQAGGYTRALDIGCGEGRFCRMLAAEGTVATGVEPTAVLREAAQARDPKGTYLDVQAEALPFADRAFDLVVSYLTLIDIADYQAALTEMARVLAPGGALLIANLTSFNTAGIAQGWIDGPDGRRIFPIDHYLEERGEAVEWRGIAVTNWHRPLSAYFRVLLDQGLRLAFFDEPAPQGYPVEDAEKADRYARVPYFLVTEWRKD